MLNYIRLRPLFLLLLSVLIYCCVSEIRAQGIIIVPRPEHRSQVQIERQNVRIDVEANVARVETEQIFRNTGTDPLEAEYYFPVPPDAQISNFMMEINGEEVRGDILERGKARAIYEDIVRSTRDPALLEYEDYGLFKVRIFPVNPGQPQRVLLTYSQILKAEGGLTRLAYPMRRDRAGIAMARPEGDKSAETGFSFQINVKSDAPLASIYSPTDEIDVRRKSPENATINLNPDAWWSRRAEKDFVLYWQSSAKDFAASVLTYRPAPDEPGWFLLLLSPPPDPAEKPLPRDLVFVIDVSGSMRQNGKMEQAKAALQYGLDRLGAEDRFNVISFSSFEEACFEAMQPANEDKLNEARKFVAALQPSGSTNINAALQKALAMKADGDALPIVAFITDGVPTSGVTAVDMILKNAQEAGAAERRIFCFGLGFDVNTKLLDRLAADSRAASSYITPDENIEARITAFFDRIQFPALERASIEGGDSTKLSDAYPHFARLGDLYRGEQIAIAGRYSKAGKVEFSLRGRKSGKVVKVPFTLEFPEKEFRNEYLASVWAGRKIADLLETIRQEGETPELRDEVVALSKQYGIPTPYTSYLVVEPNMRDRVVADSGQINARFATGRSEVRNNAIAARSVGGQAAAPNADINNWGTTFEEIKDGQELYTDTNGFVKGSWGPAPDLSSQSGEGAVRASRQIEKLKDGRVDGAESGWMRAAGKSFERTADGWRDEAVTEKHRIVAFKYMSDAYFELLRARPDWKELGRLGERFTIAISDTLAVEIKPDAELEQLSEEIKMSLK